jgi:hypothetical protein
MNIFNPVGMDIGKWYKVTYPNEIGRLFFVEQIISGDCYGRFRNGKKGIYNWQWLELVNEDLLCKE